MSRQPVQQALALLRKQGVLRDAPGRGLIVARSTSTRSQHVRHPRGHGRPRLPQGRPSATPNGRGSRGRR